MCSFTDRLANLERTTRDTLLVLLIAGLIFLTRLGSAQLWDEDEPRNAACAREMLQRGDWVVPTFNQELRTQKPVLVYWLMMASYSLFGVTEFSARLPSALLAIGSSLLVYHLGRMLFNQRVALLAGIMLASCLMFDVSGRAATTDSALVFCVTLCLCCYVGAVAKWRTGAFCTAESPPSDETEYWRAFLPQRWIGFVPMYAALGLGALAKGPVGVLLPVAIIGLFLLLVRRPQATTRESSESAFSYVQYWLVRFFHTTVAMRPLTLAVVVCAIALPWYVLVGLRTDGEWLRAFFGNENLSRFQNAMEGHDGAPFYYVLAVLVGFFPWSIFLPLAIFRAVVKSYQNTAASPAYLLLSVWTIFWIGLFTFAATKLPSYALPAYPAVAIITARLVDCWLADTATIRGWLMNSAWGTLVLVGSVILIAVPRFAAPLLQGDWSFALIGVIPLAGGIAAYYFTRYANPRAAIVTVSLMAVLFSLVGFGVVAPKISRQQSSLPMLRVARQHEGDRLQVGTFCHAESSVIYYAETPVARFDDAAKANAFLNEVPHAVLLTPREKYMELRDSLPPDVLVLRTQQRFARPDEMLLLLGRDPVRMAERRETMLK
ncbi:MAG: glycosyltransferase family 39 protein [Planctomycetota bacterium]|nr:glycosyltransferase family 39 protein [Planctomycetota bacterium]